MLPIAFTLSLSVERVLILIVAGGIAWAAVKYLPLPIATAVLVCLWLLLSWAGAA